MDIDKMIDLINNEKYNERKEKLKKINQNNEKIKIKFFINNYFKQLKTNSFLKEDFKNELNEHLKLNLILQEVKSIKNFFKINEIDFIEINEIENNKKEYKFLIIKNYILTDVEKKYIIKRNKDIRIIKNIKNKSQLTEDLIFSYFDQLVLIGKNKLT